MLTMVIAKITVSTDPLPIKFGQALKLHDWAHPIVADDIGAPDNGFLFRTTPPAAVVLYQTVQGRSTPIYITPESLLPPRSTESLIPLDSVAIWFQRDGRTATMIDSASVNPFVVPMTTRTMTAEYNAEGKWIITSESIDYTHGKYQQKIGIDASQG